MDTNRANTADFAWSALLQFAGQHSEEALQRLLAALKAEATTRGDRDAAKLHLIGTWSTAYSTTPEMLSTLTGLSAAERDAVSAAEILRKTGADAGKVLVKIARAVVEQPPL